MDRKNFLGKTVRELLGQRDFTVEKVAKIIGWKIGKPILKYVTLTYDEVRRRRNTGASRTRISAFF